jgi:hypothetical protein
MPRVAKLAVPVDLLKSRRAHIPATATRNVDDLFHLFEAGDAQARLQLLAELSAMIGKPTYEIVFPEREEQKVFDLYFKVDRVRGDMLHIFHLNLFGCYSELIRDRRDQESTLTEHQWQTLVGGLRLAFHVANDYLSLEEGARD